MTEHFDIYDEALNHIGVKPRDAVHRDGDWHRVFHCWVVCRDHAGAEFVIMQKRGPRQDTFPGKIDVSAAGHLEAGESVRDGVREIEEELGLQVDFDALTPLGRRLGVSRYAGLIDRQIFDVFLYECNLDLAAYNYCQDEIAGLVKLSIGAGIRLLSGRCQSVSAAAVGFGADRIRITPDDFIPSIDNYTLKALQLARRYFTGDRLLFI